MRSYSAAARSPSLPSQRAALGQRVGELLEEQAPQRARVARVAGEQRALHRLGQVDEREHRAVEVGDVRREPRALGWGQVSDG